MKFPARQTSGDFDPIPAGNHVAICNAVVDLGLQEGRGMYPDPKHEVYIRFETPTERVVYTKDGAEIEGPKSIGRTFTASMSEKANLRKFVEGWFAKKFPTDVAAADFDLKHLIGKKCLLNVTHNEKNGKTYANASAAAPIPKGMSAEYAQHNQSLYFSLEAWNQDTYSKLPKWLQEKIENRLPDEPAEQAPPPRKSDDIDDDIPF